MIFQGNIWEEIKQRQSEYGRIRQSFHCIPEIGFHEIKTTDAICEYLKGLGIEPIPFSTTGLAAYVGTKGDHVLGIRADIDALKIQEETNLPFASKHPGFMHACGHDGHIAALLGLATYLKEHETELPFRVKLIFQPSEENAQGSKNIIKEGAIDDVDAIFGLHLFSDIPCGQISVQEGPRMAQTDRFTFTFVGRGGHAGKPHQCVDATVMASEFVLSAQTIVARQVNPVEPAVVTIGSFHSGTQYNIISQEATLAGTCRSFSVETAKILRDGLINRAESLAQCYGGSVRVDYEFGSHPPVSNDKEFSTFIHGVAESIMGEDKLVSMDPMMLGEDFSWYQDQIPGVFAFVGCGKREGESYPNHHPKFDIEESALADAVCLHLCAVEAFDQFLKEKK